MSEQTNIFTQMREVLRPRGAADLVKLQLGSSTMSCAFFSTAYVHSVIAEMERRAMWATRGLDELTPLERLGAEVMFSTLKANGGLDVHEESGTKHAATEQVRPMDGSSV